MNLRRPIFGLLVSFALIATPATAQISEKDKSTIEVFQKAGESGRYFKDAYGFAVFPSIGKGGVGIGGARGTGRVYEKGKLIGESKMTQLSAGLQLGGQVFSQIIFFEDERALREFTGGNFEFGAGASAVAITAGAGAEAGTGGSGATASAGRHDAATTGGYHKGFATFTVAKGGLMYEASLRGQKFNFKPKEE